ncbi:hypothetical protein K2173_002804 [Erythroxylum novogranatense]|uniref:Disease resistance R13L4/SHOC-2-like LRR domain-containing protein n=1 Tax=Erythroxylum novogranatense TaxID=1862640 RepID=A0AAV8SQV3_9ROSI|nr:hypothetical protein K2173_002804 [Erythroxylum novogranatense]
MAVKSGDQNPSPALVETVAEIIRLYRSLPPRPSIEEVEAAMSVIKTAESEEQEKVQEILKQERPRDVPEELFYLLQEVRRTTVLIQSHELRKEALHLVEVDKMFATFAELIQKAYGLVSGDTLEDVIDFNLPANKIEKESLVRDQNLVKKEGDGELQNDSSEGVMKSSSTKATYFSGEEETEKLSLMKVAAIIEKYAKCGTIVLDLKGRLMDQVEWLPVSIGKLSAVKGLDLSENRIMALPPTISSMKDLTKLDLHSNQLINFPDSIGELINLTDLDVHANRLRNLPPTFGNLTKLTNLDLSSNEFTQLAETIGNLTSLKKLNLETNELEGLPYTIGSCSSLLELRLDFNQLKAFPEAIGKLECLEILTAHYNRIKGLPTTMGNLTNLKELDVSFNELESIPENLCFVVGLKKLNVGKNFADLRALPRSIGNLNMLEEMDISDNQIRVLPVSFRFLSNLRIFRADETPLEVPPRQVAKLGAQAVVQYMADFVNEKVANPTIKKTKKKGFWFRFCFIIWPAMRNRQ